MWAGIKHALNSTLGTSDFQPLDKIIKSQRTYAPSDDILVVLGQNIGMGVATSTPKIIENVSIKSFVKGFLRVKGTFKGITSTVTSSKLIVYENGEQIASSSKEDPRTGESYNIDVDFPIEKGNTYTFYIARASGAAAITINDLQLCGRIVDLSMLEYTTQ